MKRPRILIADDHSLVLKGITGLLDKKYELVGMAENGKDLVDAAARLRPEVVILDISMPVMNGIDAAREIKRTLPATKVIVLTMHSNAIYLRKALDAGASGYVLKAGAAEELLTAIETVLGGGSYVTPAFDRNVLENVGLWRTKPLRSEIDLTGRQRQILQMIAEGKRSKEIADILNVSVRTIEFHRMRLMTKLGAHSVAELIAFAMQEGLIAETEQLPITKVGN